MGDYSEAWENKNIHFGVAEESEQVLVEDRISSSGRIKECCVQITVGQ